MVNILFWNIYKKKTLLLEVVELCHQYEVDLLILAESKLNETQLIQNLNRNQKQIYSFPINLNQYLSFYYRYPTEYFQNVADENRVAIRRLCFPIGHDIIIVAVHLPSKLHKLELDQYSKSTRIAQQIKEVENRYGHQRTLVIGDFNMNPFEAGMISASGFHGVMTQEIAQKRSRTVDGEEKHYFYNPMWGRMGDYVDDISGTYYYNSGGECCYFWNTFDQVLLRPDLLKYFSYHNLHIISKTGNKSLIKNNKIDSNFSDHLPIFISLDIDRTITND